MYDSITPEQWVIGIVVSLVTFAGLVWLLWHYFPMSTADDDAPVRADSALVREAGSTGSSDPVLPHLNQAEPVEPAVIEPVREPVILHNLSRSALIALLSVQRNEHNGYRFSKNQIAAFVGGTKADVLKEIDLYRVQKQATPPAPARVDRPANGWNKA
jgi:hypothetical protein